MFQSDVKIATFSPHKSRNPSAPKEVREGSPHSRLGAPEVPQLQTLDGSTHSSSQGPQTPQPFNPVPSFYVRSLPSQGL